MLRVTVTDSLPVRLSRTVSCRSRTCTSHISSVDDSCRRQVRRHLADVWPLTMSADIHAHRRCHTHGQYDPTADASQKSKVFVCIRDPRSGSPPVGRGLGGRSDAPTRRGLRNAAHPAGTDALREGAVVRGAVPAAHPPEAAAAVAVDRSAGPALCTAMPACVRWADARGGGHSKVASEAHHTLQRRPSAHRASVHLLSRTRTDMTDTTQRTVHVLPRTSEHMTQASPRPVAVRDRHAVVLACARRQHLQIVQGGASRLLPNYVPYA